MIPCEMKQPLRPIYPMKLAPYTPKRRRIGPGRRLPSKPEKPAEENHTGAQTRDAHVLDLLKKFPSYPSLYIDAHGGTFSPDTPAAIRGEAVLYENPFYNELKNKS